MFRTRVRDIAHPGIRQFILRTAVLSYLGKCLKLQSDDLQHQRKHLRTLQLEVDISESTDAATEVTRLRLIGAIDELRGRLRTTHKLLQREYDELFAYMMEKRELWDSPEYFKAKTALGIANHQLKLHMAEQ